MQVLFGSSHCRHSLGCQSEDECVCPPGPGTCRKKCEWQLGDPGLQEEGPRFTASFAVPAKCLESSFLLYSSVDKRIRPS